MPSHITSANLLPPVRPSVLYFKLIICGLKYEHLILMLQNSFDGNTCFVKIHCPYHVVEKYASIMHIKKPVKVIRVKIWTDNQYSYARYMKKLFHILFYLLNKVLFVHQSMRIIFTKLVKRFRYCSDTAA